MSKEEKKDWMEMFAEAFNGIVVPHLHAIEERLGIVENRLSLVEEELKQIKETVERIDRRQDQQDDRLHDCGQRIASLEKSSVS
ncbi:MAG: hypothetical protein HYW33_01655 [Candidatus Blackburnbacteria bacterium]|nr:hypothetical protein [Candidatus Blackburnbacteria bacterium]